MLKAENADKSRLIEYLKVDIDNCVYLYIDIKTYDICSENVNVWFDEKDGEIQSVVMKYYDSFQVYSRNDSLNVESIVNLIDKYDVSMISGPKYLIEKLASACEKYIPTYGSVFECEMVDINCEDSLVETATVEDAREVAELLCTDSEFAKNYKVEVLAKQLADRISDNVGRTYFIRADGKIVASSSTFAEADDVAVLSGSIVSKEYRDTDYYGRIGIKLNVDLCKEGKRAFAFASGKRMIAYNRLISRECATYGKLHKKR